MAKPDCDDGWIPYAHELDAALAVADFSKGARIVLREVFSQTFGLAKNRTATLSPSEIAGRVGMVKQHIVGAISELVQARVLIRVNRGEYRFIKDYERWIYPSGKARLSKTEIAWCMAAPYVAKVHQSAKKKVLNTGAPIVSKATSPEAPIVSVLNNDGGANRFPLGAPIVSVLNKSTNRNGRGIELETEIRDDDDSREELNPIRSAEHQATVDLARQIVGDEFAATVIQMGCDIERSLGGRWDCYRAAMSRASKPGKNGIRDMHAYCIRVGGQYAATGIPPEPVAFKPTPSAGKAQPETITAPAGWANHIAGKKGTR